MQVDGPDLTAGSTAKPSLKKSIVLALVCGLAGCASRESAGSPVSIDTSAPSSRGVIVQGAVHWPMEESPQRVIPELATFLDSSRTSLLPDK